MKNWTIGVRIAMGFAAVLLTVVALGIFAHAQITSINRVADALTQNSLRACYLVGEMRSGAITQYLLLHEHIASNSKVAKAAIENQMTASRARNSKNMDELGSLVSTDKQREIIGALKQTRTAYTDARGDVLKVSRIGTDASNRQALLMEEQIVKPIYTKYIAQQEGLVELSKATAEQQGKQIHAAGSDAQTGIGVGLALAIFLGICLTIFIMKSITNPLAAAVGMLERVANGDLTATLHIFAKDEVGHMAASLNDALAKLRSTLQGVADNAANASSSSRKMAAAAETIASGSQEQAASLEETAASLEQITATVRQSAENARQASEMAVWLACLGSGGADSCGERYQRDGGDQRVFRQDVQHHFYHRRNCVSDQSSGS